MCEYLAAAGVVVAEQDDRIEILTIIFFTYLDGFLINVQSMIEKIPSTKTQITNNTQIQISNNSNDIDMRNPEITTNGFVAGKIEKRGSGF